MIRSFIISSLALSLFLVAGCDKPPEGTTPPDGDSAQTADAKGKKDKKDKKDKKADKGDETASASDLEDPTKKVCPATTADYPEPYFDETVLIRLPKGVTADNFIEETPALARLSSDVESVSCVEDVPGAMISFMALAKFQDDKAKDLKTFRDETLAGFGYVGVEISEESMDESTRFYQAVLDAPADATNPEPAKALLQMASHNDMMYVIVFETHPNAWNALKETFAASAKMSFL